MPKNEIPIIKEIIIGKNEMGKFQNKKFKKRGKNCKTELV